MNAPQMYKAKDLKGNSVTGYFVMLHMPYFTEHGERVSGYTEKPHLFNDSEGERSEGSFWHEIDISTLEPIIQKPIQLNLFE